MESKYNIGNFGNLRLERAGAFLSQAMIEEQVSSQMETGIKLQKLSIVGIYIATMIMQMVMARDGKDQSISVIFSKEEQEVLGNPVKNLEGKTEKQKNPHPPDRLSWATWIIARLGGWSGYQSDSKAGPITMRYGLKKFENILSGWRLAKDVSTD